jgi:hypothetical protein
MNGADATHALARKERGDMEGLRVALKVAWILTLFLSCMGLAGWVELWG